MAKPGTFGTDTRFVEQGDFCTCFPALVVSSVMPETGPCRGE